MALIDRLDDQESAGRLLGLRYRALGFVNTRPFVTAKIIGATTIEQLDENIRSVNVTISEELKNAIHRIHMQSKNPAAV